MHSLFAIKISHVELHLDFKGIKLILIGSMNLHWLSYMNMFSILNYFYELKFEIPPNLLTSNTRLRLNMLI
jgi:hypothetical protein